MKTARYLAAKAFGQFKNNGGIDPKFFNEVAQFAHFGMMFTVTTIVTDFCARFGHEIIGMTVGFCSCLIYAAWHEFMWDPTHENAETRGSDLEDFIFLVAGAACALLAFGLR